MANTSSSAKRPWLDAAPAGAFLLPAPVVSANTDVELIPTFSIASQLANSTAVEPTAEGTLNVWLFWVTRSGNLDAAQTVDYAIVGGTSLGTHPTSPQDFAFTYPTSGTLTFGPGVSVLSLLAGLVADDVEEGPELFEARLSNPSGGALIGKGVAAGVVTEGAPPSINVGLVSAPLAEGNDGIKNHVFRVTRAGFLGVEVRLDWRVEGRADDTHAAASADDFAPGAPLSGTITFASGASFVDIAIPVRGDTTPEADESFVLLLDHGSHYYPGLADTIIHLRGAAASSTIANDDTLISIAATTPNALEGNGGTTTFTFSVTRSGNLASTDTVDWSVTGLSTPGLYPATATDFTAGPNGLPSFPSGTLTFTSGATVATVAIAVAADGLYEPDEQFSVTLSNPSQGVTLGTAAAQAVIENDDSFLTIATVTKAPIPEGDSGTITVEFTVERLGAISAASTATWSVIPGPLSRLVPEDFVGGAFPSGTISFAPGPAIVPIKVALFANDVVDGDATFSVTLSGTTGVPETAPPAASATIIDDDTAVTIETVLVPGQPGITEGSGGTTPVLYTIRRLGVLSGEDVITWSTTPTGANPASATDFLGGAWPSGQVTFAPYETTKVIGLNLVADSVVEPNETFALALAATKGTATISGKGVTTTILDDDTQIAFVPPSGGFREGLSGTTQASFTLVRTGVLSNMDILSWYVATAGVPTVGAQDFAGGEYPVGVVTFAAGQATATVVFGIAGDTIPEPDESFIVALAPVVVSSNLVLPTPQLAQILNTASAVSIAADAATVIEGQSGSATATFTVSRTGDLSRTDVVDWIAAGAGSAPADAKDFAGGAFPSGHLTFSPMESRKTITVPIAGDTEVEGDEDFAVTITAAGDDVAVSGAPATTKIGSDDTTLRIEPLGPATILEGHSGSTFAQFAVQRAGGLSQQTVVAWAASAATGGPADATDFIGGAFPTGTITFASGQDIAVIAVPIAGDLAVEGDEVFSVSLSVPPGADAVVLTASATATIANDDTQILIAGPATPVTEGHATGTPVAFTLTRTGDLSHQDILAWSAQPGVSPSASTDDFAGGAFPQGVVSFAEGASTASIVVTIAGDSLLEPDETFAISLVPVLTGLGLSLQPRAEATIRNDDAGLSIAPDQGEVLEGQSGSATASFTVTRSGDLSRTTETAWAAIQAGDINAADFAGGILPSGRLTFAPGESHKAITVAIAGDTDIEGDEMLAIGISASGDGLSIGTATAAMLIRSDDASLRLVPPVPATIAEDQYLSGPATFTVQRAGDLGRETTVYWQVTATGPTPASPDDFIGGAFPSGTLTFAPGQPFAPLTVPVASDTLVEVEETFALVLSLPPGDDTVLLAASATATIANDDTQILIAGPAAPVPEGQAGTTPVTFTLTRSGVLAQADILRWAVQATVPLSVGATDFAGGAFPFGSATFAPGATTAEIVVPIAGDTVVEPDESFAVVLTSVVTGGGLRLQPRIEAVIANDDATLSIAAGQAQAPEGQSGTSTATFVVTRTGNTAAAIKVAWSAAGITGPGTLPADAADFAGGAFPSGTLTFAAGETSRTLAVAIAADQLGEFNERFAVTLSSPSAGATIAVPSAEGVILNDDYGFAIRPAAASVVEGNAGITPATFTVTRSGVGATQTISWAASGIAGAGTIPANAADFAGGVLPSGSLTFAPGDTSKTITVGVSADLAGEFNERFAVDLSNPSLGATIETGSTGGLILNDDTSLSLRTTRLDLAEGNTGTTAYVFTVSRNGTALPASTTVDWAIGAGTVAGTVTANAADFPGGKLPGGTLTFAAGETSRTITVPVAGDTAAEAGLNESFTLVLSNPSPGVAIIANTAAGVILNDDRIVGSPGNDILTGTPDADVFLIGSGLDSIAGGAGTDLFQFLPAALGAGNAATFEDFSPAAGEKLDLSRIDAIAGTLANDAFTFIQTAAFSGAPGELRWHDAGTSLVIEGNTGGDTAPELTIALRLPAPVEPGWLIL